MSYIVTAIILLVVAYPLRALYLKLIGEVDYNLPIWLREPTFWQFYFALLVLSIYLLRTDNGNSR